MLLHVCCGPCLIGSISRLLSMDRNEREEFGLDIDVDNISEKIILFYFNPNIDTFEEYEKRLIEVEKVANYYDLELIYDDEEDFLKKKKQWELFVKNYEDEKEGGKRCSLCIEFRMNEARDLAKELNTNYSTTLSISPYKSSEKIFLIGKGHDNFVPVNFKKKEGYKFSILLSKEFGMYRQSYCGCCFSKNKEF